MTERFFIAGTDTEVGKTYITCGLIKAFQQRGLSAIGLKPLASGCESTPDGLRNDDALHIQAANSWQYPYQTINPIAFEPPIAPHIAAEKNNEPLNVARLLRAIDIEPRMDRLVIEGVGGWFVPLNNNETMADFVKAAQLPVILVVGMRLGCLNHALLTVQAIKAQGVPLVGWIANQIDPNMPVFNENLNTLKARINVPCWGVVPYQASPEDILSF